MKRKLRIAAIIAAALITPTIPMLVGVYYALQHVRPFYQQAMQLEPQAVETGSRELESRATALYSEARQSGRWQAAFTADQINGWLALQFPHVNAAADAAISAPRVAIGDDAFTLGFCTRRGGMETVVTVDAAVFLTESGEVAVHLLSMRAGALPLPVMQAADEIARACGKLSLPVHWTQQDGRPIALIDVAQSAAANGRHISIDAVELREGSLFVAGHTEASPQGSRIAGEPDDRAASKIDDR